MQGVVCADGVDHLGMDRPRAFAGQAVLAFGVIDAHGFARSHTPAQVGQLLERDLCCCGQRIAPARDPERLADLTERRWIVGHHVKLDQAKRHAEFAHGIHAGLCADRGPRDQRQRGMRAQDLFQIGRPSLPEPAAEDGQIEHRLGQDFAGLLRPWKVQPRHALGRECQQQVVVGWRGTVDRAAGRARAGGCLLRLCRHGKRREHAGQEQGQDAHHSLYCSCSRNSRPGMGKPSLN
ncbi:hypothetical protein GALL_386090 [mine drainage metagenome]|uniref:Uncharacterized protein n=1 Tax=mine drainage metagenome TaxID=410659 RepID=A0A1J5Q7F3_9ZZZZ